MLTVTIIAVGRLKDKFYEDAAAEYAKRLGAYCKLNITEIRAAELPEDPGAALIADALRREGQEILKKIPASAYAAALCIEGKQVSSEDMGALLRDAPLSGKSEIVFIIGGSYGLSDEVKKRADARLSMSRMTFPHRLARVMLLEQIYRGFRIARGEKYHK